MMDITFEEFAQDQAAGLLRAAYLLTGNQQDAEDLAHDTLVKVQVHWRSVAASRNPPAYVSRILTNHFLSAMRKRAPQLVELTEQHQRETRPDFVDQISERDALTRAIRLLPERERTAVVLRHYLDLDSHEIAQAMGTTSSTVRSTLSRGVATLREQLKYTAPVREDCDR